MKKKSLKQKQKTGFRYKLQIKKKTFLQQIFKETGKQTLSHKIPWNV